jgi:hypothetical protein
MEGPDVPAIDSKDLADDLPIGFCFMFRQTTLAIDEIQPQLLASLASANHPDFLGGGELKNMIPPRPTS